MLTQIKLTNFKRFTEETTFPLSNFNLFTGVNGSGKSTLIQVLLLISQSDKNRFILNGDNVQLGNSNDVISMRGKPICFEFESEFISDDGIEHLIVQKIRYELFPDSDSLFIEKIILYFFPDEKHTRPIIFFRSRDEKGECFQTDNWRDYFSILFPGYLREGTEMDRRIFRLHELYPMPKLITGGIEEEDDELAKVYESIFKTTRFILADRIGSQEFYIYREVVSASILDLVDNGVGVRGELTVDMLYKQDELAEIFGGEPYTYGKYMVNKGLCIGSEYNNTLLAQTEEWLGKILTPLKINIQRLPEKGLKLTFGGLKPVNVGFGYSSILPIIVAGLTAKPGERLIVENPEIHLHPKAQSALTQFLIEVAKTGVQVFVESHSDHVLNAVRVAVKEEQIDKEDVSILFHHSQEAKVTPIKVDKQGELSEYPADFFDEYSNQLFKLV